ncbi:uncharacterized protein LOC132743967 [Ruditapes philippinarum]|uniref:uncharacterized protein LOC132743967 n=1 Tax=Ruditapes philippinarum TaxID=129788 RepID=UPI00295BBA4F|nr:uncharacterized protein LOC132743967 [Ruditapes philippinarum]
MLFYLLSAFVIFGLAQGQGGSNCPPVSSLECFCDQNNPARCNRQGFLRLTDGTYCTGCRVNLPQSENGRCPSYRCHRLRERLGCELLPQFAIVGMNLCPACSVLFCPNDMPLPTVSLR